ncbi:hypothetical protein [Stenotrophomonas sp. UBA7606]|uniref:hypothetical protein n=1 Tax=Stenotrophomonas sp. UBA7606 TaxID=1947559 RepID=UPI0025EF1FA7|nr:hypothetical protein [Stenotrophomonas sp. UBA7606]
MTSEVEKPQPVDNSHLDAGIAARDSRAEAEKEASQTAESEQADEQQEAEEDEQNDTEESAASEADDAAAPKPRKGVGKRIDELTREKYDAQRERDYWREQATRGNQQQAQPVKEADSTEPTLEGCEFDVQKYNAAWYEWKRGQERKAESQQKREQKLQESAQGFAQSNPDYFEVISNPYLRISQDMVDVIADTDNPAALAYYLGKNPQEAERISAMNLAGVARAIGRIEAELSAPPPPRQITPKAVTKAPPPVTTLTGAPAVVKSLEEMSMREYDEQRRKERKQKGLR